jgi:hypothetical protein
VYEGGWLDGISTTNLAVPYPTQQDSTPVPKPVTFSLLGVGLAGILLGKKNQGVGEKTKGSLPRR